MGGQSQVLLAIQEDMEFNKVWHNSALVKLKIFYHAQGHLVYLLVQLRGFLNQKIADLSVVDDWKHLARHI